MLAGPHVPVRHEDRRALAVVTAPAAAVVAIHGDEQAVENCARRDIQRDDNRYALAGEHGEVVELRHMSVDDDAVGNAHRLGRWARVDSSADEIAAEHDGTAADDGADGHDDTNGSEHCSESVPASLPQGRPKTSHSQSPNSRRRPW